MPDFHLPPTLHADAVMAVRATLDICGQADKISATNLGNQLWLPGIDIELTKLPNYHHEKCLLTAAHMRMVNKREGNELNDDIAKSSLTIYRNFLDLIDHPLAIQSNLMMATTMLYDYFDVLHDPRALDTHSIERACFTKCEAADAFTQVLASEILNDYREMNLSLVDEINQTFSSEEDLLKTSGKTLGKFAESLVETCQTNPTHVSTLKLATRMVYRYARERQENGQNHDDAFVLLFKLNDINTHVPAKVIQTRFQDLNTWEALARHTSLNQLYTSGGKQFDASTSALFFEQYNSQKEPLRSYYLTSPAAHAMSTEILLKFGADEEQMTKFTALQKADKVIAIKQQALDALGLH